MGARVFAFTTWLGFSEFWDSRLVNLESPIGRNCLQPTEYKIRIHNPTRQ